MSKKSLLAIKTPINERHRKTVFITVIYLRSDRHRQRRGEI